MRVMLKPPNLLDVRRALGIWAKTVSARTEEERILFNAAKSAALDRLQAVHGVTDREREILALALDSTPKKLAAGQLEMDISSLHRHHRNIASKCQKKSIDAVVHALSRSINLQT